MAEQTFYIDSVARSLNMWNKTPYHVVSERGMANVGLTIQTQSYPFEDGSYYLGAKAGNREFQLGLWIYGTTYGLIQQYRGELFRRLSRRYAPGSIRRVTSEGITRQIDCWLTSGPIGSNDEIVAPPVGVVSLGFEAPWPYWYDPSADNLVTADFGATSGISCDNEGDVDTWPIITISSMSGLVNPSFTLNGETIEFDYTFPSGTVVIDLRRGQKTVYLNGDTDISYLGYITRDSILWSLVPGVNTVVLLSGGRTGTVSIDWTEYYITL